MARPHKITAAEALAERWRQHHANPDKWFWLRVDKSGGKDACWPWLGRVVKRRGGYGRLVFKGKQVAAHRMALSLHQGGKMSDDKFACHRCDNPICCNPRHLFWGTPQENVDDCITKGRKRGAPRIIDVPEMLKLRAKGWTYSQLAERYSVNQSSIGKAIKRAAALRASQ